MTKEFDVNSIDWDSAPEDATHFAFYRGWQFWMKTMNDDWYFMSYKDIDDILQNDNKWILDESDQDPSEFIPRPVRGAMKEWDGTTKLEVGMMCMLEQHSKHAFAIVVEIKYNSDNYVVWTEGGREYGSKKQFVSVYPIKSKEQVEREEAVEEMRKDLEGRISAKQIAEDLINKGWRKTK